MSALLELAADCEQAEAGVFIGEQTKVLLSEAWKIINPMPPHRIPKRPDGEPWGGDGLGPISPEYQEWDRRRRFFFGCLDLGAFESAAMTLVPEGWTRLCDNTNDREIVELYSPDHDSLDWVVTPAHIQRGSHEDSFPLALCAAALRARVA